MTRDELRLKNKRRRIREVARKKTMLLLMVSFMLVLGSLGIRSLFASAYATEQNTEHKYYKSIVIEEGDSLWSIATEYTNHHSSTKEFVNEMIQLNQLKSKTIHKGQHLIVPYYDDHM